MSASEKVKALGKAVDGMQISDSDRLWLSLQPEIVNLRNALPQIVAVVEAAEKEWAGDFASVEVGDALTALKESLP